jgi:Malectin domain
MSSSLPIVVLLLLFRAVQCQLVPSSMFINCGNSKIRTSKTNNWMNDVYFASNDGSAGVMINTISPTPSFWQKLLGIKPKVNKPKHAPYDSYRKGKNITYAIPVAKTPTKYNVTLYFYEPT